MERRVISERILEKETMNVAKLTEGWLLKWLSVKVVAVVK
jgi:hypothetical protein